MSSGRAAVGIEKTLFGFEDSYRDGVCGGILGIDFLELGWE